MGRVIDDGGINKKLEDLYKKEMILGRKMIHSLKMRNLNQQPEEIKLHPCVYFVFPNHMYYREEVEKETVFYENKEILTKEMTIAQKEKKESRINSLLNANNKNLLMNANNEMAIELRNKMNEKTKKKTFIGLIFKHRDHNIFNLAKNLKLVYQNYI